MTRPTRADRPGAVIDAIAAGRPLRPTPTANVRPWAGRSLGAPEEQVGELWLVGPAVTITTPLGEEVTLDSLAALAGTALVGEAGLRLLGPRFPLIVKLIDAAEWLSLQVHPSDELAVQLYGEGALGKTEALVILDAEPGTELITGPRAGLGEAALRAAIADGTLGRNDCEVRPALPGDVVLIEAGTIHAVGAGAFVYEIEQPSDLTFRISDWGRPPVPGRHLHPGESLRAVRPDTRARTAGHDWRLAGGVLTVPEFRLEIADLRGPILRMPAGRSLEVVTAIQGEAQVAGEGWTERLARWETLVVPASAATYRIDGAPGARVCIGSVP